MDGDCHESADAMTRDTLVFRAGVLARTALSLAFGAPHMHAVYAAWLCSHGEPCAPGTASPERQTLMEAGLERGGRLFVLARKRATEFVVMIEHEDFNATACVVYDPSTERVNGLHLVQFEGKALLALAWLEAAALEFGRRLDRAPRSSLARQARASRNGLN